MQRAICERVSERTYRLGSELYAKSASFCMLPSERRGGARRSRVTAGGRHAHVRRGPNGSGSPQARPCSPAMPATHQSDAAILHESNSAIGLSSRVRGACCLQSDLTVSPPVCTCETEGKGIGNDRDANALLHASTCLQKFEIGARARRENSRTCEVPHHSTYSRWTRKRS